MNTDNIKIVDITTENVADHGIFCIKDQKSPGYHAKVRWFKDKINKGLKIKIAMDSSGKQLGFIEFIPSELAWRPVKADNYFFIHCIAVFVKEAKDIGIGSLLLHACELDALQEGKSGICALSSEGPWMAGKEIFTKNNFLVVDQLDRFELLVKSLDRQVKTPQIIDFTKQQIKYVGWHLLYADQCPWHQKSITDLGLTAAELGIDLHIEQLRTPEDAQNGPSGFGTFSLLKDGVLLADHYISATRFKNIVKQQLGK